MVGPLLTVVTLLVPSWQKRASDAGATARCRTRSAHHVVSLPSVLPHTARAVERLCAAPDHPKLSLTPVVRPLCPLASPSGNNASPPLTRNSLTELASSWRRHLSQTLARIPSTYSVLPRPIPARRRHPRVKRRAHLARAEQEEQVQAPTTTSRSRKYLRKCVSRHLNRNEALRGMEQRGGSLRTLGDRQLERSRPRTSRIRSVGDCTVPKTDAAIPTVQMSQQQRASPEASSSRPQRSSAGSTQTSCVSPSDS